MSPRIALQFHPDWPCRGERVIEAMARDGRYVSQFVTGTSNGGLTAFEGGDRWSWESRIFAGRYDAGPPEERPVYGALDHRGDPYGGCVRFGSAHLRLREEVLARATFCFPDSFYRPVDLGGPEDVERLVALAEDPASVVRFDLDDLDRYVEAHVHGAVRFDTDVEAVVLDHCFRDGPVHEAAERLGCVVEWHPGFRAAVADLDPAFRGPEHVALAAGLAAAHDGVLVPSTIGDAARAGTHDPQSLKRVWHLLARYGRPFRLGVS